MQFTTPVTIAPSPWQIEPCERMLFVGSCFADNIGKRFKEEKFREIPLTKKEARTFARFFFAGAAQLEIDKQGRVLIPSTLREHASLDKEVVLVGVLDRVEIWDKKRWEDTNTYSEDEMDEIAEKMAELGIGI